MYSLVYTMLGVPATVIIVLWIYHNLVYQRARAAARNLPTTFPTLPLLGNLHQMLVRSMRVKALEFLKHLGNRVDSVTCLWLGPHPLFVLSHAEDIQAVLSESKTSKSGQYELLKFVLGEGLITASEDIHSITRRYINPLFKPRNLENLTPIFNNSSRQLVQSLSEHVGRGELDLGILAGKTTLMNIACLLFGAEIKMNINSKELEPLTMFAPRIGSVFFKRSMKPWLWFECVFRFLMRQEIDTIAQLWRQFADGPLKIIERRANQPGRKFSNEPGFDHTLDDEGVLPEQLTLPDTLKSLKEDYPGFTDDHVNYEMTNLVMAGIDTTKVAISSCLLVIADNSDIQENLVKEISQVMGSLDKDVTIQDLHDMHYLDQVFKETLRKFCIIPMITRKTKEDIKLRNCTIPAHSSMIINFVGLHHNTSEFPEPEKFDPDRFSPERVASMKRFSYLPFSAGSRNCIGSIYSGILVKTVVVHILRRYRLTTSMDSNNLKYRMGIGFASYDGYKMQFHDRS